MQLEIPTLSSVDLLVLGASSSAVKAAVAAKTAGRRVLVASHLTYPGEDICAFMRYWKDDPGESLPTPMRVKCRLERAMLNAGVDFIYGAYPVAVLRDDQGRPAGAVIANRSGFQAVKASTIIDATERALYARMLPEGSFRPWRPGEYALRRVVAGDAPAPVGEPLPGAFHVGERKLTAYESHQTVQLADASPATISAADVVARLATWYPGQLVSSDLPEIAWRDRLEKLEADNVFVMGPCADACATFTCSDDRPVGQVTVESTADTIKGCDVVRRDRYFRLSAAETVAFDLNRLPVLGEVDVLVAGGGTAGAPAGIAAGRAGAKTLIVEATSSLGGVGTEGRIARYWYGNRVGFTREIDRGVHALGPDPEFAEDEGAWNTEWKKHWYLRECARAGTQVWFGSMVVAVAMDGSRVCGAVMATPYGHGLVRAGVVVDCSGNGDVAAAAGAETVNISNAHVAVQGSGLSPLTPGEHYQNTDYTFIDDTDVIDTSRAFAVARKKFADAFDVSQVINSRQRQQIRGELSLDPVDFLAERTYPDTITTAQSNFDSHGFTIHPVFMAKPPDHDALRAHVPLRCLLPAGVEGVLVTGLGVSSHRDSLPVIRMQPDVQNQGYAAGRAAAMASQARIDLRQIDIRALQLHLVEIGLLDAEVQAHEDSFPLTDEAVASAVLEGLDTYRGLAVIFGNPERSLPLLKDAYGMGPDPVRRLCQAHIMALMGDDAGLDTLIAAVDGSDWDEGWPYTGMGQFGFSLSPIDSMLAAMGRTGNAKALPAMLRKLETLGPGREFSHYRAITLAFEAMPAREAAARFEELLEHAGSNACSHVGAIVSESQDSQVDTTERNRQLTELLLARGLLACGDPNGKARSVLEAYRRDLHGHYARHAQAVLEAAGHEQGSDMAAGPGKA